MMPLVAAAAAQRQQQLSGPWRCHVGSSPLSEPGQLPLPFPAASRPRIAWPAVVDAIARPDVAAQQQQQLVCRHDLVVRRWAMGAKHHRVGWPPVVLGRHWRLDGLQLAAVDGHERSASHQPGGPTIQYISISSRTSKLSLVTCWNLLWCSLGTFFGHGPAASRRLISLIIHLIFFGAVGEAPI